MEQMLEVLKAYGINSMEEFDQAVKNYKGLDLSFFKISKEEVNNGRSDG